MVHHVARLDESGRRVSDKTGFVPYTPPHNYRNMSLQ